MATTRRRRLHPPSGAQCRWHRIWANEYIHPCIRSQQHLRPRPSPPLHPLLPFRNPLLRSPYSVITTPYSHDSVRDQDGAATTTRSPTQQSITLPFDRACPHSKAKGRPPTPIAPMSCVCASVFISIMFDQRNGVNAPCMNQGHITIRMTEKNMHRQGYSQLKMQGLKPR